MNKLLILIIGAAMTASCGTVGTGAYGGAMLGGIIGSSIGGIAGGPRGSDIGTLVGLTTGAMTGAAIANAAEAQQSHRTYPASSDSRYGRERYRSNDDMAGRSEQPIFDDIITMEGESDNIVRSDARTYSTDIRIENVRFINDDNTMHISKGELVKISFEVRNVSDVSQVNIVPMVRETTGNKRLVLSPATMIERLAPHKAIRYTAYISAQNNLKSGKAHFFICAMQSNTVISNTVDFEIPLE